MANGQIVLFGIDGREVLAFERFNSGEAEVVWGDADYVTYAWS
tara:strand:- start:1169 stop:1297 length:129 start_codon:yes stop_codon:yes gene_type:complete